MFRTPFATNLKKKNKNNVFRQVFYHLNQIVITYYAGHSCNNRIFDFFHPRQWLNVVTLLNSECWILQTRLIFLQVLPVLASLPCILWKSWMPWRLNLRHSAILRRPATLFHACPPFLPFSRPSFLTSHLSLICGVTWFPLIFLPLGGWVFVKKKWFLEKRNHYTSHSFPRAVSFPFPCTKFL